MSWMMFWIVLLLCSHLGKMDAVCPSDQIRCKSGNRCISHSYVCDGSRNCLDNSDEDPSICRFWKSDSSRCGLGRFYCSYLGCTSASDICSRSSCSSTVDTRICELVKRGKLTLQDEEPKVDEESEIPLSDEFVGLLQKAVNMTSVHYPSSSCPMFYSKVGDMCLSFFSPAKIPWPEARQFCLSMMGDLLDIADVRSYGTLLQYIRASELTSNYWIGGRFDLDTNSWSWVTDDTPMPLGSPYWATRYSSSCVPRSPPHNDPFNAPAAAVPGAPCSHYVQAPAQRKQGWCAALTYEHYYYISDEECQENRSPLCIYIANSSDNAQKKPGNSTQ